MLEEIIQTIFSLQRMPGLTLAGITESQSYQSAWHYLVLESVFVLMALLWGAALSSLLMRQSQNTHASTSPSAFLFISVSTGIAIVIAELFLLVLFQRLTLTAVTWLFAATSALAVAILAIKRTAITSSIPKIEWQQLPASFFVFLMLAAYQFSSIDDWRICDATSYHLPYADFFLLNKGLDVIPEFLIYPYHSLNMNLLYSLGTMFERNLSFLQTIHAFFGTLTAWGLFIFCRETGQKLFLSLVLLFIFIAKTYAIYSYRSFALVDNGSMYFIFCAALSLYFWKVSRANWLLVSSAISFGIAVGIKYLMFIFALPIAISIIMTEPRTIRSLATYTVWAACWGLWWYIRNFIYSGNPVHPFASNIFGLYLWNADDVQSQMSGLLDERIPRTIAGFALMPYYAYKNSILSSQDVPALLSMTYAATVMSFLSRNRVRFLLLFIWIYTALWFLGAQDARYLMPIMPLVLVYTGAILNGLLSSALSTKPGKIASGFLTLAAALMLAGFIQTVMTWALYSQTRLPAAEYELIMRNNPEYDLVSHANEIFDEKQTAFEFYMRDIRWFFKGTMAGNHYGPHGYQRVTELTLGQNGKIDPAILEKTFRQRYSASGFLIPHPPYPPYDEAEFDAHFDLRYRNAKGSIYTFKNQNTNRN